MGKGGVKGRPAKAKAAAKVKATAKGRGGKRGGKGKEAVDAVAVELERRGVTRGSPAWVAAQGSERFRNLFAAERRG